MICKIDYCAKRAIVKHGICENHLRRKQRGRSDWFVKTPNEMTTEERFWSHVNKNGPVPSAEDYLIDPRVKNGSHCWQWLLAPIIGGYGRFQLKGRGLRAHKFSYQMLVGKIPEGLELDHLCRNTLCVNPEHLEPVTSQENIARTEAVRKSHCIRGHELAGKNLRIGRNGRHRACRECAKIAARRNSKTKAALSRITALKEKAIAPEGKHGTESGYGYYKGRCQACKDGHATYHREFRARHKEEN